MATLERTAEAKRLTATLAGGTAVLLWALLALFTTWASGIPPFQLVSLCFTVAALIGFGVIARKGRAGWQSLRQPVGAWALGSFGLFGYHFFYFMALGNAPAVEASLIAYLWPLLIVIFSALLPGERLRWFHLAGALLGLAGAGLLVTKGQGLAFDTRYGLGYLAAVACALTWSIYSVANRRFGSVPTDTVAGFCAAAALLGFISHALFETWVIPTATQWGAILLLGLGPVGAAAVHPAAYRLRPSRSHLERRPGLRPDRRRRPAGLPGAAAPALEQAYFARPPTPSPARCAFRWRSRSGRRGWRRRSGRSPGCRSGW